MHLKIRIRIATSESLEETCDMEHWDHEIVGLVLGEKVRDPSREIIEIDCMSGGRTPVAHILTTSECDFAFGGDSSCEDSDVHERILRG